MVCNGLYNPLKTDKQLEKTTILFKLQHLWHFQPKFLGPTGFMKSGPEISTWNLKLKSQPSICKYFLVIKHCNGKFQAYHSRSINIRFCPCFFCYRNFGGAIPLAWRDMQIYHHSIHLFTVEILSDIVYNIYKWYEIMTFFPSWISGFSYRRGLTQHLKRKDAQGVVEMCIKDMNLAEASGV